MNKFYLGSIAMEKNRWAPGRVPTYKVSDFANRAVKDGFAGIELWENHYFLADAEERKNLAACCGEYIFNSYLTLADGFTDDLKSVADAVTFLGAKGIKYNFAHIDNGVDHKTLMAQRDTLLKFAEMLPCDVKLLCECHGWTAMEEPERAASVFETLDERFGAIIHLGEDPEHARKCFECYGDRIWHIHSAASIPGKGFVCLSDEAELIRGNMEYFLSKGFNGTITVEFIKDADDMESYYNNALIDLKYLNSIYKR